MLVTSMFVQEARISQLWELDVIGVRDPIEEKAKEERNQEVHDKLINTLEINDDGRYHVQLPWKYGRPTLPTNYQLVEKRLTSLTKKLRNENQFNEYNQVLYDWLQEGIIEMVQHDELQEKSGHYLPHRHVIKEGSTTRMRPVFDASAKIPKSLSLNDCLETGPNLIELIPAVITRFRFNKIGVVSDIRKAFLQISVSHEDRDYLKFLWWRDNEQNLIGYKHTRVVFGLSCSPFLLSSVINFHLQDLLDNPKTRSTIFTRETVLKLSKSFYVDNCIASVSNAPELDRFIRESRDVMKIAKMDLRGWEYSILESDDTTEKLSATTPVLGLIWNRKSDTLGINTNFLSSAPEIITKRVILSVAHKLYDPIGFLCPLTICPKILLQEAWNIKIGWDEEVPFEMKENFKTWCQELKHLVHIQIPRWLFSGTQQNPGAYELHTFCDASKTAYAAVVFIRTETREGIQVQLLQAKSRVVPIKKATIPRLELLAATIAARLTVEVQKGLETDPVSTTFWSDSTTVLAWIKRDEPWGTFVFNRVAEIRQLTHPKNWKHVAGAQNPADLPSRGCSAKHLENSRWWEGPA